jgi:predicted nuclease of predicted toxin-antitoxin system
MRFLADENFPRIAVDALRGAGHDVTWVRTDAPGASDEQVLALARVEQRVLLTFDKDFGELVLRRGLTASGGVVLFRIPPGRPGEVASRIVSTLAARADWAGSFSVVEPERVRMRALIG